MTPTFLANDRLTTAGIFVAGSILYLASLDFAASGDALYYANIIDTLRFDQLSLHQGYYVAGLGFAKIGLLFGLSTDQSLVIMNAFFGAAMLAVAYPLLRRYLDSRRDALVAVVMLLACHRVFFNATMAEVYAMQTFLLWSSYLLFEKRRFYWAGLVLGIAMWTSPLTLFFCLWFPVVAWIRGFGIRSILQVAATGALVYMPYLAVFYEELLWGTRGLLTIDSSTEHNFGLAAANFAKFQFKHYSFVNLLIIPALFAIRRERSLMWMTVALVLPNLYIITKLNSEDNVFILTLDLLLVCWFMVGWRVLRERSLTWVAATCLAGQIIVFILGESSLFRPSNFDYGQQVRAIGRAVNEGDNSVVFADWARRMAYVYYNRPANSFPLEGGKWYEQSSDIARFSDQAIEDVAGFDDVYVLDSYRPSGFSKLFLGEDALANRYESSSIRRKVERTLELQCELELPGAIALYRCR